MTRTIYLLRHAKAVPWGPGIDDFSRVLSERGRQHMLRLANWMRDNLPEPGCVLCSPSARTIGTISPILETFPGLAANTEYPDSLYGAGAGTIFHLAETAPEGAAPVLLVGHNPGFENLAFSLMGRIDGESIHKMPTGTLGVFDVQFQSAHGGPTAMMRHWVRRKDL
jgi:phosphohistidine phosphatase